MCNEAVQIVDRVLPNVHVRQWVLSLPWELGSSARTTPAPPVFREGPAPTRADIADVAARVEKRMRRGRRRYQLDARKA